MNTRLYAFVGGEIGEWRVVGVNEIVGDSMVDVPRLRVVDGPIAAPPDCSWQLEGITSNERYVTQVEKRDLVNKQAGLGRDEATSAALIPIRKTDAWWSLAQDQRRRIFEYDSDHIKIGLKYLPAIARRLFHCRDFSVEEPFDFLTWFEFAPSDTDLFDLLLKELRATKEWTYIDREVDIRLRRD